MKNTLAENMLRFGSKNLDPTAVRTLKRLAEQTVNVEASLNKLSTAIPKFLDMYVSKPVDGVVQADPATSTILYYNNREQQGIGMLNIYRVQSSSNGIPVIIKIAGFINNKGSEWRKSTEGLIGQKEDVTAAIAAAGKSTGEQLNNLWNPETTNIAGTPRTIEILNAGVGIIKTNAAKYKTEFFKITRNKNSIKYWWVDDNPQKWDRSAYYMQFVSKLQAEPAKAVYNVIQDTELVNAIMYKVKNFNSTGKYPIEYPTPVI